MNQLDVAQGQFIVERFPSSKNRSLQAWDGADLYLLKHLHDTYSKLPASASVLVVNDSFGALSLALSGFSPVMMTDSFLARKATLNNFNKNNLDSQSITILDSLQTLDAPFDLIIIKIPKTLALLEDQLYRIRQAASTGTVILAAGMTRNIHTSTLKLFERIIGPTKTSLAWKKARLIFSSMDETLSAGSSPYPTVYQLDEQDGAVAGSYINHANVFSRDKLDLGSRFLLPYLPVNKAFREIVDMACGNGVLGIAAAVKNPQANIVFTDESTMAVESARQNAATLLGDDYHCEFMITNGLEGIKANSIDLIINNPPFHQENVVGDDIAWDMFKQAQHCLRKGGALYIVANRHLAYHVKLKRIFGHVENIASNKKFVVLKSVKK